MSESTFSSHRRAALIVRRAGVSAIALAAALTFTACSSVSEKSTHGFVITDQQLQQINEGSSREQVLLAIGSPSATADFDGEVFYYISQQRLRPVAFMNSRIVDQSVVAVYFDDEGLVKQVANYGTKDGKVFDFVSRTTKTGGSDVNFLEQMLLGIGRGVFS